MRGTGKGLDTSAADGHFESRKIVRLWLRNGHISRRVDGVPVNDLDGIDTPRRRYATFYQTSSWQVPTRAALHEPLAEADVARVKTAAAPVAVP